MGGRGETRDKPRCEADADGRYRYRDVSRRENRGMLCVTEQCHKCRMVRETAYGRDEAVVRRRFYDPGRRVPVSERPGGSESVERGRHTSKP